MKNKKNYLVNIISFLSLVVLIVAIYHIITFTNYTLNHKGVREEIKENVTKKIDLATSNISTNSLSEIYNVYFNKEKHKLKCEYTLTSDNNLSLYLRVYLDGSSVLNEFVGSNFESLDESTFFESNELKNTIKITEDCLNIIESEKKEYLVLQVNYLHNNKKTKYFVIDNDCNLLSKDDIIGIDDSYRILTNENNPLTIFYDIATNKRVKIADNSIYNLAVIENKEGVKIEERKYTIKDSKLKMEVINTYDNLKLEKMTLEDNNEDKDA